MNYAITFKILGLILAIESVFMLPPFIMSYLINDGATNAFLITILIMLISAVVMIRKTPIGRQKVSPKDGLLIVSLAWIIVSIFGAVPLYVSKSVPTYVDALFEIISGFTTTGATVISNIEQLPKSIVLWRSMTHWIGGMGILVFTLSLLPKLGVGGFQIFKAESPGPVAGKIEPKTSQTAKRLYVIYMFITVILFGLLLVGGMTPFDAIIHTLGTVGTGGFSSKADSVGAYSGNYIPIIMTIFMIICGTNFTMHYYLYKGKFKEIIHDDEFRAYYIIIFLAILIITLDLYFSGYGKLSKTIVDSSFQVSSVMSTSGYSNANFDLWPTLSKYVLLILFFTGSCAGSTAGGMKIIRIVVVIKMVKREIVKALHPKAVVPIKINNKIVNEEVVLGISSYLSVYILIFVIASGVVASSGVDLISSISSVATMLSNVGPGFSSVGPTQTFGFFAMGYKLLFCALMLLGRLEFFTLLALITPRRFRERI